MIPRSITTIVIKLDREEGSGTSANIQTPLIEHVPGGLTHPTSRFSVAAPISPGGAKTLHGPSPPLIQRLFSPPKKLTVIARADGEEANAILYVISIFLSTPLG